ncbi:hypothetical protein D3C71_1078140 [compost metagenome]
MSDGVGRLDIQRHELDAVIHAVGAEQASRQRIVEGLVQLAVDATGDQRIEAGLHVSPQRLRRHLLAEQFLQLLTAARDASVVKLGAFHRVAFRTGPVACLETFARAPSDVGKTLVVALEAFSDAGGDALGQCRRNGGCAHRRDAG